MGLDITAYRKLRKVENPTEADRDENFTVYANDSFPGRAAGLEDRAVYQTTEDAFGLRAGSYGGYSWWRDELAKLAGYPQGTYEQYGKDWPSHCVACWNGATGPFSELINFSDCEGAIGPEVSAKLAKDFADFDARAKEFDPGRGWYERYCDWRKAFEMAADDGAVQFH